MGLKADAEIAGVGIVLVILGAWYLKSRVMSGASAIADVAASVVPYVNPADSRNGVYAGVSGIGGAISGNADWTLGTWIYDITH